MQSKRTERNPRRGLQKLSCDCGAIVYGTWAQVEQCVPVCGRCGVAFVPEHPELAALVCSAEVLESHPWVEAYERKVASVRHGQAGPSRSLRNTGKVFEAPEVKAWEFVRGAMRDAARQSQLSGLRPATVDAMPF